MGNYLCFVFVSILMVSSYEAKNKQLAKNKMDIL